MEVLVDSEVFKFHKDTLNVVRKEYGLDRPGRMKEAVDILEHWVKKQKHFLKKDFHRRFLESVIISRKGSLERAKTMVDRYCTFRTLMPHMFTKFDREELSELFEVINAFPAPYLNKENERFYVARVTQNSMRDVHIKLYYKYAVAICDYIRRYDYNNGLIFVVDFRDVDILGVTKLINILELRDVMALFMEGYGLRIKAAHILTDSNFIEMLIKMMKQVISTKLGERIKVHKNVESLHQCVDKKYLPQDLEGSLLPCAEYQKIALDALSSKENMEYVKEMNKCGTDESFRNLEKFNEQYIGMPGTFRTLAVD